MSTQSFLHDLLTTISNEETFLQEANASEFQENLEEMSPGYYTYSDVCNRFNFPITH